jgi:hypothetical protein
MIVKRIYLQNSLFHLGRGPRALPALPCLCAVRCVWTPCGPAFV